MSSTGEGQPSLPETPRHDAAPNPPQQYTPQHELPSEHPGRETDGAWSPLPTPPPATPAAYGESAPAPFGGTSPLPKRRNVVAVWLLLPLITLGVYGLVWYYKINRETRFNPGTPVSPFVSLIAVTLGAFLIIPPFVSVYRTGQRIADAQRAAGIPSTCTPVLGLVLAFVFGLYSLYYQAEMNKIVDAYPGATTGQRVPLRGA